MAAGATPEVLGRGVARNRVTDPPIVSPAPVAQRGSDAGRRRGTARARSTVPRASPLVGRLGGLMRGLIRRHRLVFQEPQTERRLGGLMRGLIRRHRLVFQEPQKLERRLAIDFLAMRPPGHARLLNRLIIVALRQDPDPLGGEIPLSQPCQLMHRGETAQLIDRVAVPLEVALSRLQR